MAPDERALAARRGLARVGGEPRPDPAADAQARLRATLDEIGRLDAELEALSDALADFSRRWERALGDAFRDVAAAERLVRRLQAVEDGIAGLAAALRAGADAARDGARGASRKERGARRRRPRAAARGAWADAE